MDMFEIMSTVRDLTGLKSETVLGTPLLKRYINMGQDKVSQLLLTLYKEWLIKSISGTGTGNIALPGDVLSIVDATRATIPCEKVPTEDRSMIGWSANHPGTAEFPAFVQEGASIIFYPALSSTAYGIRYRKRLVAMIEGSMPSASTSTVTLPAEAQAIDDLYNDHQLTLYSWTSGVKSAPQTFRITDYVGSTKVATINGTITHGPTTYYGALWSLIPSEYHQLIVDGAMYFLARMGLYKNENPVNILNGIQSAIQAELGITGPVKAEMDREK